jgi:hypothetical protein
MSSLAVKKVSRLPLTVPCRLRCPEDAAGKAEQEDDHAGLRGAQEDLGRRGEQEYQQACGPEQVTLNRKFHNDE